MKVDVDSLAHDAPPPKVVLRITNPLVRLLLRTPLGRLIRPLAVIEFRGRRSGKIRRIVVGWHFVDGSPVVLTPARWRVNFDGGAPATVRWRGNDAHFVGTLETDPDAVAATVETMLRSGTSARSLALRVPVGHTFDASDVVHTRRALIRFAPTSFET